MTTETFSQFANPLHVAPEGPKGQRGQYAWPIDRIKRLSSDVHGLKWKCVDLASRLIIVRENFVLGEDEYTKTDGSQRETRMNQVVFCNREGKPLDNKNLTDRVWSPLLRHFGLKPRRPYQMRHTAATLWLASGEAPEWIARQLGHTSTEMLFRTYSRFVPNLTRQDGSAFDRLLATRFASGGIQMPPGSVAPKPSGTGSDGALSAPPGQPPPVSNAAPAPLH